MDRAQVAAVRAFNRAVTQRVGALRDGYLARGRPLGHSRVLWEVPDDGVTIRALRERLDLDSGYLSRVLAALEREGLVVVGPDPADRRRRRVVPTAAGRAERALLDRRSDDLAWSMLAPLDPPRRERLVAAMAQVRRLLEAAEVVVAPVDPADDDARACLAAYAAELAERFDGGFDPARSVPLADDDLRPPHGVLLVARLHGRAVGCGAVRVREGVGELKRMWVAPDVRGLGLARRLLGALEAEARVLGARVLRLETNRALVEAVALYRSAGFVEVAPFSDEPYAHHWFEKDVDRGGPP